MWPIGRQGRGRSIGKSLESCAKPEFTVEKAATTIATTTAAVVFDVYLHAGGRSLMSSYLVVLGVAFVMPNTVR